VLGDMAGLGKYSVAAHQGAGHDAAGVADVVVTVGSHMQLAAEVQAGKLELKDFSTKGPDFQLDSSGTLRLRDPFGSSLADLRVTFKFMDAYKNKSDITRGLFGAPDSKVPGLFDLDPKIKRAKAADGSYGWRASGQVAKMNFAPAADSASTTSSSSRRRAQTTRKKTTPKKAKK